MLSNQVLFDLCKDKKVLQLGAVGDYKRYLDGNMDDWDFTEINKVAKKAVGGDIDKIGVKMMQDAGFDNIVYADAEDFDLKEKFDVIFAGDIIEHLNNVGNFLESCKKHMQKDSILAITTPNPYALHLLARGLVGKTAPGIYGDHTAFFHEKNIRQLLKRCGMTVKRVTYYTLPDTRSVANRLMNGAIGVAAALNKGFHQTYLLEAILDPEAKGDLTEGKPRHKGQY